MDPSLIGNSAAILTAFLWTGSSILFTSAGKRIGFFSVNAYRSAITVGMLVCAHVVLLGYVLPAASGAQWFWMGLSGIIGLGIGDLGLFAAYILIGPRLSLLLMASSPIFASVSAFLMLGETFPDLAVLGVAVTLAGDICCSTRKGSPCCSRCCQLGQAENVGNIGRRGCCGGSRDRLGSLQERDVPGRERGYEPCVGRVNSNDDCNSVRVGFRVVVEKTARATENCKR